jgi:DNA-binding MarR family transcriptional regulator
VQQAKRRRARGARGSQRRESSAGPVRRARRNAPSSDVTEILARFRVIFRSARRHYSSVERELGISGAQLRALALIASNHGAGVTALARALLVRQPTASKLVEQLVGFGFVKRRRSRTDQRATELSVTASGAKLLERAPGPLTGVLADALATLPKQRLRALGRDLDQVLNAMRLRDDAARYVPLADL